MRRWFVLLWMGCTSSPDPAVSTVPTGPTAAEQQTEPVVTRQTEHVGIHQGVQHPPIPANSPAWRHDPGGFVPDARFYGERDWDGVRMRVAGHIAVIERDRARLAAGQGRYDEAGRVYSDLERTLRNMIPPGDGPSSEIPRLAMRAAKRDAALMYAIAANESVSIEEGLAGVRSFLLTNGDTPIATDKVTELKNQIDQALSITPRPDIDAFSDFDDRHALRVRLWSLYLDAVDPIHFRDSWGYFRWQDYEAAAIELRDRIDGKPPKKRAPSPFSVEGAGGMPTGDSLIDVAGQPGPKAIGRLEKLSLDEPKHRQWIEDTVYVLNTKMKESPGGLLPILDSRTAFLDGMGHGSRYYNIKQLRNEVVRRLADIGRPDLARRALAMNHPLHHQDWECPNRAGILAAIDGRLAAVGNDKDAAKRLVEARQLSDAFLQQVADAAR